MPTSINITAKNFKQCMDWYDYGAHFYDPELCQWHAMDPACEKYYDISPYEYCAGNPIRLIDSGGEKIVDSNGNIAVYYDNENNYHYTKYATNDIIRIVNSLKMTQQGKTQIGQMINSSINVKMEISPNVFVLTMDID
jgi:RHS repeat-associated protein